MQQQIDRIDSHGRTDIGRKRNSNEDRFLIADLQRQMVIRGSNLQTSIDAPTFGELPGQLLMVADGVGGHVGGEIASTLAVETVSDFILNSMHRFLKLAVGRDEDFRDELVTAIERCQRKMSAAQADNAELTGMGTTLTMAYIIWPRMYVVHLGDSRCYLLRNRQLRQLTTDHTVAQKFVDAGTLLADDVSSSPWRHVIWNCIASDRPVVAPDVQCFELQKNDLVVLCSDGLSDRLNDTRLAEILCGDEPAQELTRRLVDAANACGGDDNITAIVSRFTCQSKAARSDFGREGLNPDPCLQDTAVS